MPACTSDWVTMYVFFDFLFLTRQFFNILFFFQSRSTSLRILQRLRREDDLKKRNKMQHRLLRDFVPPFYLFEGVCDRVECEWDDKIII